DSDKPNPLQRRARSWSFYRRRYNYSSERVNSQQQQDSGDVPMDFQARYAPYAVPSRRQRSSFQKQEQMHINVETKQKPSERRMERDRQNETLGSWFKIIIPFGIKYDEKWLLNLIQKQSSVPFTAFEFHYEKMQAQFFVENANIAGALKNVNGKIFNEDNETISIFVEPCDAPKSVQKALKSEKVEQMKLTINKPYDVHQQSLDIQRLLFGPGMAVAVTVGQVKSAGEMDKGQQLEPEGMWVDRNATCTTSPDKSTNMQTILELFPRLLSLDGQETLSGSKCATEAPKCLPTCKGSFFGSDELKSLILQFLQHMSVKSDPDWGPLWEPVNTWGSKAYSCLLFFVEVEGRFPGCVRSFTRTFITTPATSSSFCIVNDKLLVSDFSPKKTEPVLFIPKPKPVNSMPTFSLEQQKMVQDFSIQSGRNFQQSQK
ncbi:PREDICTED: nuclear RNA export factor 3-like, partial [Bison bison bison]|uniref:Nuclear RNA export factor 3-like n=1 Tax=Bison bison bison TaxID=43346 RepID=A0A6P3H5M3_BISBB